MSKLRRYFNKGQLCFLTSVTHDRCPLLVPNGPLLLDAIEIARSRLPFDVIAFVVMPDHLHFIIDPSGNDVTKIMQRIKMSFGSKFRKLHDLQSGLVWQRRYWDHIIRNPDDLETHIDYIHYNPVKHGLVTSPFLWEHSSIHRYKEQGYYRDDWGVMERLAFEGDFGE